MHSITHTCTRTWLATAAIVFCAATDLFAQRAIVQQPVVQQFQVGTTVVVPDGGAAFLGGVSSAASARSSYGPFRSGTAIGLARQNSAASTHVHIHDFATMDEHLRRVGELRLRDNSRAQALLRSSRRSVSRRVPATVARNTPTFSIDPARAAKFLRLGMQAQNEKRIALATLYFKTAIRYGSTQAQVALTQLGAPPVDDQPALSRDPLNRRGTSFMNAAPTRVCTATCFTHKLAVVEWERYWLRLLIGTFCLAVIPSVCVHADTTSRVEQWMWTEQQVPPNQHVSFQRQLQLSTNPSRATIVVVADFCRVRLLVNGALVGEMEPFQPSRVFAVSEHLRAGANSISLEAAPQPGPSAVSFRLEFQSAGQQQTLVSDREWRSALLPATGSVKSRWLPVSLLGDVSFTRRVPHQRDVVINELDDYTQWKQALGNSEGADPSTFALAPGFQISRVRSAQPDEDSWIALAFDPQGRVLVARESRGLLRFTLSTDGARVTRVENINSDLKECRGLVFAQGALYANANESRALYRLSDAANGDKLDRIEQLRAFPGSAGHGRNNLAIGPDGRLYSIHGDAVDVPRDMFDRTSPFREHRQGKKTREGHLVRTDLDGQNWQLIAAGLRNPFGIAFNTDGEAFTYDADAEHDMGAPWYRPTRVVHLVSGADYGWRGVTGSWPPYFPDHPDNGLPNFDVGKGSPTGVAFGTHSNFPAELRRALFILDWAYGRILAVHMSPVGASYVCRLQEFAKGRPFNLTGLTFGPDGAMYVVTGGRKTQSALYRISFSGESQPAARLGRHESECLQHAQQARKLRHRLERGHGRSLTAEEFDAAWHHLADLDPRIQHAARVAVEHQPFESWSTRAAQEAHPERRSQTLLACARNPEFRAAPELIASLLTGDFGRLPTSRQRSRMYLVKTLLEKTDELPAKRRDEMEQQIAAIATTSSRADLVDLVAEGVELLAALQSQQAVAAAMQQLRDTNRPVERMRLLYYVRNCVPGWSPELRENFLRELNGLHAQQGGAGMPMFLQKIRSDFLATCTEQERERLQKLFPPPQLAPLALAPITRALVKDWQPNDIDTILSQTVTAKSTSGRQLFEQVQCAKCHRVAGVGAAVGPDLTSLFRRFSRQSVLESILDPSKVVDEQYRSDQIVTRDGRVIVGRVIPDIDYRSEKLRISTFPYSNAQELTIRKADVESHTKSKQSVMPRGLLNTLTQDEILELLAFLESGGR